MSEEVKIFILGLDAKLKKKVAHNIQKAKLENNTKNFRIGTVIRALEALGAKVKLSVELDSNEELIVA